tara:strand:- start:423 stop:908 length:486 start_codon:yes stop_codon:yes gene_type:complete
MKILIIRTLKSELIPSIVKKLEEDFDNPKLNILTHENQETLAFIKNKFSKIYIFKENKDFRIGNIKFKMLQELKKENFDIIILPRMFNTHLGFLDVIILSFFLFPKKVAILPYKKNFIYISKIYIAKYIIVKFLGLFLNLTLQLIFWPILFVNYILIKLKF